MPAMPALIANANSLVRVTLMPAAAAARSFAAHCEESPAHPGAPHVGDRHRTECEDDGPEDHERRVLVLLARTPSADVDAEERRILHERRDTGAQLRDHLVLEVHALQCDRGGDGDHRELDTAYSHGR